jgi:hypothetical protein
MNLFEAAKDEHGEDVKRMVQQWQDDNSTFLDTVRIQVRDAMTINEAAERLESLASLLCRNFPELSYILLGMTAMIYHEHEMGAEKWDQDCVDRLLATEVEDLYEFGKSRMDKIQAEIIKQAGEHRDHQLYEMAQDPDEILQAIENDPDFFKVQVLDWQLAHQNEDCDNCEMQDNCNIHKLQKLIPGCYKCPIRHECMDWARLGHAVLNDYPEHEIEQQAGVCNDCAGGKGFNNG